MPKEKQIWDDGECLPDYNFWKRTAYWTVEEGVALTLDKEPRLFNRETLKNAPNEVPIVSSFFEWLELANRAIAKSKLPDQPAPEDFLEWRKQTEFDDDGDDLAAFMRDQEFGKLLSFIDYKESYLNLEKAYRTKCKRLEELENLEWEYNDLWDQIETGKFEESSEKKRVNFDGRKKKSLQKILLAVSVIKYRFDPRKLKSSAPKNIESATEECGLLVTDETIRSHLREAADSFPEIIDFFESE